MCLAGYACPEGKSGTERECPIGTYSVNGQSACTNCSSGMTTNAAAASSCIQCPAGKYCTPGVSPASCQTGYYSNLGDGECTKCPAGYSCTDPALPSRCSAGFYSVLGIEVESIAD